MAEVTKRLGSLQRRIASGKAEPISERERAQLRELRNAYVNRFGKEPEGQSVSKQASKPA